MTKPTVYTWDKAKYMNDTKIPNLEWYFALLCELPLLEFYNTSFNDIEIALVRHNRKYQINFPKSLENI